MSNFKQELQALLNPRAWHWLLQVSEVAVEIELPLYLVGGIVRDVLLGRSSLDLDLVVEGSGIALAEVVHGRFGGRLATHEKFGTANWRPEGEPEIDIDFVTARIETYTYPAALPDVTPSTIEKDLFRRDFTINGMAIRLDGAYLGDILDLYEGQQDLQDGLVRVMHEQSFVDDPTRIWRGMRFSARFGFPFAPDTAVLIEPAKPYLKELSIDRVRHELELILREENPIPALDLLTEHDVLVASGIDLLWNEPVRSRWMTAGDSLNSDFGRLVRAEFEIDVIRLIDLLCQQNAPEKSAEQLHVSRKMQDMVAKANQLRSLLNGTSWREHTPKVSDVVSVLAPFQAYSLAGFVAVADEPVDGGLREFVTRYYLTWRHIRSIATGKTLRDLGLKPGPHFRDILWRLTAAWLDGDVSTPDDEAALLRVVLSDLNDA